MAIAGCAATGDTASQDRRAAGPVPVLLRSADLRLPLDDYLPSIAESNRLARASRTLLRQCMRELGFDYATRDPGPSAGPLTSNERRYGLTDPAQARRGYWPESRLAAGRSAAGRSAAERSAHSRAMAVTAAEGAALTGQGAELVNGRPVPPGGCAGAAQRRLTGHDPPGADTYLAQRLTSDSFFGSQQEARVRDVTQRWATCMKAAGHDYAGPLDPPKDVRFQRAVTPLEIATARTDVACKERTNLVGVWFTVESTQQRSLIEANRAALQLARTAVRAELAVATGVGA